MKIKMDPSELDSFLEQAIYRECGMCEENEYRTFTRFCYYLKKEIVCDYCKGKGRILSEFGQNLKELISEVLDAKSNNS